MYVHTYVYELQKPRVLQMICALTSVNDERLYLDYIHKRGGKIGSYQFEKKIGSGTYGKVYRASHRYTGYVVAIKSLEKTRIRQQNMTDKVSMPPMLVALMQIYLSFGIHGVLCGPAFL
jgi:serine/threonine protein kinase